MLSCVCVRIRLLNQLHLVTVHYLTERFARLAKQFSRAPLQAIFTLGGDVLLGGYGFWLLT